MEKGPQYISSIRGPQYMLNTGKSPQYISQYGKCLQYIIQCGKGSTIILVQYGKRSTIH